MKNATNTYSRTHRAYLSSFALCIFLVTTSPIAAMSNGSETLAPASVQINGAKLIHSFQENVVEEAKKSKVKCLATFDDNGDLLISPGWFDETGYSNPKKPEWAGSRNDPRYDDFIEKQENELRNKAIQVRQTARKNNKLYLGKVSVDRYTIQRNGNLTTLVPAPLADISPTTLARLNQSCNSRLMNGKACKILASACTSLKTRSSIMMPPERDPFGRCTRLATFFAPYFRNLPQADSRTALPKPARSFAYQDSNVKRADSSGYETTRPAALKDERTADDADASTLLAYSQIKKSAEPDCYIKYCNIQDLYSPARAEIEVGTDDHIMGLKFSSQDPQKPSRLAILTRTRAEDNQYRAHVHITDISHKDIPILSNYSERLLNTESRGKIFVHQGNSDIHVRMEWSHDGKYIIIIKQDECNGGPYEITTYDPETHRAIATCTIENPDKPGAYRFQALPHWGALSLSPDYSMLIIDSKVYELPQAFAQAHTSHA